MSEILKLFPTALTRLSVTDPFLSVAIFCGVGMLATLLLLIFDQNLFRPYVPFHVKATRPRCDDEGCPDRLGRASHKGASHGAS
jgi:hypothetical protein